MANQHYTPCNVGIYIGGYKISEAFRVDWDARDSKTPLYGWADSDFTAVSPGRRIVTGRLVINYRYPGYLHHAIRQFEAGQSPINRAQAVRENDLFDQVRGRTPEERVKFLAQLAAKNYGDNTAGAGGMRKSMVTTSGFNDLQRGFDILIAYGDIMSESHIEVTIKNAYIVGQSQTISASATGGGDVSSSGSPIYEIYSFFAKEIVEDYVAPRDNSASPASNVNTIQ